MDDGIAMVEGALLLGPPAAVAIYFVVRALARWALPWMLAAAMAYIAIILLAAAIGLSFAVVLADIASIALVWPAWCFCCACGCWAKPGSLRDWSWYVAVISIGPGYLLGTLGFLLLSFDIADATEAPIQYVETPGLACEVTGWGGFGTDSGYLVVLYRRWTAVPWLRFPLTEVRVDQTVSERDVSCADLMAAKR